MKKILLMIALVSLVFASCKKKADDMTFTFSNAVATENSVGVTVTPSDLARGYFLGILPSEDVKDKDDAQIIAEMSGLDAFKKYTGKQTCSLNDLQPETDYMVIAFASNDAEKVARYVIKTLAALVEPETPEEPSTPEEPETPEQPETPETPETPEQPENQFYKPGDYYNVNGVMGVVFYVDESGKSGLIMSLDQTALAWSIENVWVNCLSVHGSWNTEDMLKLGADKYPAARWCVDHGQGWYMPSSDEMHLMWNAVSNGKGVFDDDFVKLYNEQLVDPIEEDYYWSSSEITEDMAEVVVFIDNSVVCLEPYKWKKFNVRAVYKF